MPRRFMKKRTVLPDAEAEALGVVPGQRDSCSDTILLSSRGGNRYDRTFLEAFLRPGAERLNWTSRAGTVTAGVLQTGPRELSKTHERDCPELGQPVTVTMALPELQQWAPCQFPSLARLPKDLSCRNLK